MKIPKELKVGGHPFTVVVTDLTGLERAGDTNLFKNEIRIDSSLPQSQKEATLIHEIVCHAINPVFGDSDLFHALSSSISEQLYQVLSDNKLLR